MNIPYRQILCGAIIQLESLLGQRGLMSAARRPSRTNDIIYVEVTATLPTEWWSRIRGEIGGGRGRILKKTVRDSLYGFGFTKLCIIWQERVLLMLVFLPAARA